MKTLLSSIYLFLTSFGLTFAQIRTGTQPPGNTSGITLPNPFGKGSTIFTILDRVATWLLTISVLIAGIMVIYGAFLILTGGASVDNVEKGKKTILYALIGLGIILLFKVLIALIAQLLGVRVNI